ncbi:MAG: hypothetical protein KUG51_01935 [Urechidicola sp.]|nr:hypothetical protein [Urechidicola sp.]
MKLFKFILLFTVIICTNSCVDNNDDPPEITSGTLAIQFNHDWNGLPIDFDDLKYTNAFGDVLSISKLRYLISNFVLHLADGSVINLDGYILVDLNSGNLTAYAVNIPFNNYTAISFTFGFDETDNIDGAYPDLNSASWNWPEMLGGGYHFMQFEGKYEDGGAESPFAYHNGTARVSTGVFEANHFEVNLGGFVFNQESTLNLHMNLAEWFTNPYTWDLDTYSIDLMMNYDAQKLINDNGQSVFTLGEIN